MFQQQAPTSEPLSPNSETLVAAPKTRDRTEITPRNLRVFGLPHETAVKQHSAALSAVARLAEVNPTRQFTLHTFPHSGYEHDPLEWSLVVTSVSGRQTYEISQRSATGPVLLNNKII